jgi:AraC-like DNA-binding protein
MDLLTDMLLQAGLRRRLLDLRALSPTTALRFPCDRSMGLHLVTQGQVFVRPRDGGDALVLHAGDIAVMARGFDHVLATHEGPVDLGQVAIATAWPGDVGLPASIGNTVVLSGAYQFWHTPLHPLFAQLPDTYLLRADSLPRFGPLALTLGQLQQELQQPALGTDTIVHGLLDVAFTYALREIVQRLGDSAQGFGPALRDPQVRQVVGWMHDDCAHPWTLDELAARAGMSRTGLAERFRDTMGDTPLSYLRTVRMQKAVHLLAETRHTLEQVATEVGYQDAFSFSKVFKRVVGLAPKAFRQQDAADRASPWRMGGA